MTAVAGCADVAIVVFDLTAALAAVVAAVSGSLAGLLKLAAAVLGVAVVWIPQIVAVFLLMLPLRRLSDSCCYY
jgi:hypothetical protein